MDDNKTSIDIQIISNGGLGNKVPLIVQSLAAASGLSVFFSPDSTASFQDKKTVLTEITSKKAVFDIKVGNGSFLKNIEEARTFISSLQNSCHNKKIQTVYILSDMNQVVGQAIGFGLEIIEAAETLKGKGPFDVLKLSLELASETLLLANKSQNKTQAKKLLKKKIEEKKALKKFKESIKFWVKYPCIVDDYSHLPSAKMRKKIYSEEKGIIQRMDMAHVNKAWSILSKESEQEGRKENCGVGFLVLKKIGDRIEKGDVLFEIHLNQEDTFPEIKELLINSLVISNDIPEFKPLIIEIIGKK